jgi:hypothetical protein
MAQDGPGSIRGSLSVSRSLYALQRKLASNGRSKARKDDSYHHDDTAILVLPPCSLPPGTWEVNVSG